MIFTEARFLLFFVIVFAGAFALRANRPRKLWLLLCSYAFYAAWDWRFLSLLLVSTVVDFGRRSPRWALERVRRNASTPAAGCWRRAWSSNLGNALGVFKYLGFFVDSARELLCLARTASRAARLSRSCCPWESASTPSRPSATRSTSTGGRHPHHALRPGLLRCS